MGRIKLRKELKDHLRELHQQGRGTSRNEIKDKHNYSPYIHSDVTYKTYMSQVDHFCDWCKEKGITAKDDALRELPHYLDDLKAQGKSAWTISTAANGVCKALGTRTSELGYKLPTRLQGNISRSRGDAVRDRHFSESKNADLVNFGKCTGLRRSELEALRGSNLAFKGDKVYLVGVKGKGGKIRDVEVVGDPKNVSRVVDLCKKAGDGVVFARVHSAMDEHGYRAEYACNLYRQLARPKNEIPKDDRYCCRGSRKGEIYDKAALRAVSVNLGHNRCDVVVTNYLYRL